MSIGLLYNFCDIWTKKIYKGPKTHRFSGRIFCDIFPESYIISVLAKTTQKFSKSNMIEFELEKQYKTQEVAAILGVTYDTFRHSRKKYEEKLSAGYK